MEAKGGTRGRKDQVVMARAAMVVKVVMVRVAMARVVTARDPSNRLTHSNRDQWEETSKDSIIPTQFSWATWVT